MSTEMESIPAAIEFRVELLVRQNSDPGHAWVIQTDEILFQLAILQDTDAERSGADENKGKEGPVMSTDRGEWRPL